MTNLLTKRKVTFYHLVREEILTGWFFAKQKIHGNMYYVISFKEDDKSLIHFSVPSQVIFMD